MRKYYYELHTGIHEIRVSSCDGTRIWRHLSGTGKHYLKVTPHPGNEKLYAEVSKVSWTNPKKFDEPKYSKTIVEKEI